MRHLLLPLLLATIASPLSAQEPDSGSSQDPQQAVYQESVSQEAVRKQADKIRAEIAGLLADAKLNGVDTTQLSSLSTASQNLAALSDDDMEKVVSALQGASAISADQARRQVLVQALEDEKAISLKLKSLAVSLAAQESEKELPLRLQALVVRQSVNLRQTRALASAPENQQKSARDVVSSEQSTIGGEIGILAKALAATPDTPADRNAPAAPGAFNLAKAVLDAMNAAGLITAAASATDATKAGAPSDALPKQTLVRDGLIAALIASLSNADAASRLDELKSQVHQLYSNEKNLAATTSQSGADVTTLADQQFQVSDRTLVVTALLKAVSAAAASETDSARQAMDDTAQSLQTAGNPAGAAAKQQTALDALQKAESLLDQQIAAARQEQQVSPTDKLAQLQQLSKEIDQAQKNPATTPADLQKLQQEALAPSPQAAAKIGDAASRLNQTQPDTAGANNALAQAQAAIQQQTAALQQAAQAYQALAQAQQQLAQSQQQAATANQALQQKTGNAEAARDLTQAQANLTQMNQAPPPGVPPAAQQAMQQAANALQAAAMQAVQGQNANAQSQTQNAQKAMQQAQAALGQAMAQIQQQAQGGQGQPNGQQMAQAQQPGQGQGQGQGTQGQLQPGQGKDGEAPLSGNALLGGSGAGGIGQVVGGLQPKDREAIRQFQAEKSPPEYSPLVQQYLKNIAEQKP